MLFGTVPVERKGRKASRIGHRETYSSSTAAPAIASVHPMESLEGGTTPSQLSQVGERRQVHYRKPALSGRSSAEAISKEG